MINGGVRAQLWKTLELVKIWRNPSATLSSMSEDARKLGVPVPWEPVCPPRKNGPISELLEVPVRLKISPGLGVSTDDETAKPDHPRQLSSGCLSRISFAQVGCRGRASHLVSCRLAADRFRCFPAH